MLKQLSLQMIKFILATCCLSMKMEGLTSHHFQPPFFYWMLGCLNIVLLQLTQALLKDFHFFLLFECLSYDGEILNVLN